MIADEIDCSDAWVPDWAAAGGGNSKLKSSAFLAVAGKGIPLRRSSAVSLGMVQALRDCKSSFAESAPGDDGVEARSSLLACDMVSAALKS